MDSIGQYLVRRLVGEGGMGKVYEAEERLSKRRVALKVLRPELARSEEGRRLFLNEMTILAHLDHPNVVRCLSCAEIDGDLVMALEFLDGQTVREVLGQRTRMPWAEAVGIIAQVASGLGAAHRADPPIIHRDLKPENIFMLPDGSVKVMDFGIAKVLQVLSRGTTQTVGTLQYMSPEQIDATTVDHRSDLYGVGLVLYELLAGRPPFESSSPRELLNQQCTQPPPPLPDDVRAGLPRGIERLLFSLLQKNPDDRPPSAEAILTELEPFRTADGARIAPRPAPAAPGSGVPKPTPHGVPHPANATSPPVRSDTIALVERAAAAKREVPAWLGIVIIVLLSAVAGGVTYGVRAMVADSPDAPAEPDE